MSDEGERMRRLMMAVVAAVCLGGCGLGRLQGAGEAVSEEAAPDAGAPTTPSGETGPDAGPVDAGPDDAGQDDAGPGDAGPGDAGSGDAGMPAPLATHELLVVPSVQVELGQGYVPADPFTETRGRLLPARCVEGVAAPTEPRWQGLTTVFFGGSSPAGGAISQARADRYTLWWQEPAVQEFGRRVRPDARTSASGVALEVAGQPYTLFDARRLATDADCGTHFVGAVQPGRRFEYALVLRWPDAEAQRAYEAEAGSNNVPALFGSRQQETLRALARARGATFSFVALAHGFDAEALAALEGVLSSTRCSADDFAACEATLQGLWRFQADRLTASPEDLAAFPSFRGTWAVVGLGPLSYDTLPR
jgi:hypothetical protein